MRNEINIEVAHGLTRTKMEMVKYKLGEGITGRVIETGKAVAIPKISEEPLFLDRTGSRKKRKDLHTLRSQCTDRWQTRLQPAR